MIERENAAVIVTPFNPAEPSPEKLANPLLRYFLATRPAFLSITLVGVLLGIASSYYGGRDFELSLAGLSLLLALLVHAGINVLNDYYDHLNGTDAHNIDRLFPFTGGSRFIQNGVLSPRQTLILGLLLFLAVILGGLWLMIRSGTGLFWIGLSGLLIGWAYSAPPIRLNSRGLGELSVALGFLLVVVGADFVQRKSFDLAPWLIGTPYALMVSNVLYINQFPDRAADIFAGKRHWVARLSPQRAVWGYKLILGLAILCLLGLIGYKQLPLWSLLALFAMIPVIKASNDLGKFCLQPSALAPAICTTIVAAHLVAVILAGTMLFARLLT